MSALGAIEAAESDEVAARPKAQLRLVTGPRTVGREPGATRRAGVSRAGVSGAGVSGAGVSRAPAHAPLARPVTADLPARSAPPARPGMPLRPAMPARRPPLRLTRRGRIAVTGLALVFAVLALTVVSMAFSGAQAANHGRPGGGYAGMQQVVVQPGQTLWSIANRAEPSADPRQVVEQIMIANSMSSSAVQAGQLLWVPR